MSVDVEGVGSDADADSDQDLWAQGDMTSKQVIAAFEEEEKRKEVGSI